MSKRFCESLQIIQSVLGDIKSYTEEAKEKLKQKNRQRIIDEYFSPKLRRSKLEYDLTNLYYSE